MTVHSIGAVNGTKKAPEVKINNYSEENAEKELELEGNGGIEKKDKQDENKTNEELKINRGKQDKHIRGTNNFQEGKSELTISIDELQKLVYEKAGTGENLGGNKERIDFEIVIGFYVDIESGEKYETTRGLIHYSKKGVHIVPSQPKGYNNHE